MYLFIHFEQVSLPPNSPVSMCDGQGEGWWGQVTWAAWGRQDIHTVTLGCTSKDGEPQLKLLHAHPCEWFSGKGRVWGKGGNGTDKEKKEDETRAVRAGTFCHWWQECHVAQIEIDLKIGLSYKFRLTFHGTLKLEVLLTRSKVICRMHRTKSAVGLAYFSINFSVFVLLHFFILSKTVSF